MTEHLTELVRRRPHHGLADLVAGIVGMRERTTGVVRRRQPAGTLLPLVISFGNSLDVVALSEGEGAGRSYGSFFAGFMGGYATTAFEHSQDCVQVYLTPWGAHRILGMPGNRLAGRVVAIDDVATRLGGTLPDRLHAATSWPERFATVERVLLELADAGPEPDDVVTWMWKRLFATGGQARIGGLIDSTGWSHRHVTTRFRDQLGITPKFAASVIRFERASTEIGELPLTDIAARHGYADQSHFTRDVVRYAGESPIALTRAGRPTARTALGLDGRGDRPTATAEALRVAKSTARSEMLSN